MRQVWSLHSIFLLKFFEIENSQICSKDFGFYDLRKSYLLTAEDAIVFSTFLPHSASFLANKDWHKDILTTSFKYLSIGETKKRYVLDHTLRQFKAVNKKIYAMRQAQLRMSKSEQKWPRDSTNSSKLWSDKIHSIWTSPLCGSDEFEPPCIVSNFHFRIFLLEWK